jgi:hypothetical protein
MSNHEKVSVLVLRFIFFFILLLGVAGLPVLLAICVGPDLIRDRTSSMQAISTGTFLLFGILGLFFSRKLGSFLTKGL